MELLGNFSGCMPCVQFLAEKSDVIILSETWLWPYGFQSWITLYLAIKEQVSLDLARG